MSFNSRNTDPDTSHEAEGSVDLAAQAQHMLRYIRRHDRPEGFTSYEAGELSGTSWRRMSDLKREGLVTYAIDESGAIIKRPNPSGRRGRCYRATR